MLPRSDKESKSKPPSPARMFKVFADKMPQGIVVIKGEDILYLNTSLARIIGYPLREVRNWSLEAFLALVLEEERRELKNKFQNALGGKGKTRPYEVRITDKKGRVRWLQVIPKLVKVQGEPAILVTVTDVTGYKQTEQALRDSESKYRTFLEHFQGIAYRSSVGGIPVFFHGAVKAITGYSERDFVSGRVLWQDIILPEDWILIQKDWKRIGSVPGSACEREYRIIRKDGGIRWLLEFNRNISDESGKVVGVEGHFYDITERKEAEEARHESETRYRTIVAISPDAIFLTDLAGKILIVNPQSIDLFGCKSEAELLGRRAIEFVLPKDRQLIIESLQRAIKEGRKTNIEYTLLRQDGTTKLVDASASVIIGPDGQPQALMGILRDITEQKLAEKALSESEAKYRALVEQSLQGILVTQGTPLRIVYANTAFQVIIGYKLDELLALKKGEMDQLIYPADRALTLGRAAKRLKGEPVPQRYEYRVIHKSGAIRWVRNYASLIEYEGQPAIQSAIADITERKQAELALQESEEKYSNLFQYFHDAIFLHDLEGNILDINQQVIDQLGYTRAELLKMRITDLHPPEALEAYHDAFDKIVREGSVHFEIEFKRKNGEVFPVEVSSSLFNIGGQKVVQGIARDITERKQAEQALQKSENRFRGIAENMDDALIIREQEDVVYVNDRACEIFGYPREELLTKSTKDLCAPEERGRLQAFIKELKRKGGGSAELELRVIHKDGSSRFLHYRFSVRMEEGKVIHFVIANDITKRKLAEQALLESETKYRSLVDNSLQGIVILQGTPPRIVFANPEAARMLGYSPEELQSLSSLDFVNLLHPDDRAITLERTREIIEGSLETSQTSYGPREIQMLHRDKTPRWVELFAHRVEYQGAPALQTMAIDITERKEAELALKASEEKFRALVEELDDWVFEMDATGCLTYSNNAVENLLGYSVGQMIGLNPFDFLHPEDEKTTQQLFKELVEQKQPIRNLTARYLHRDGSIVILEAVGHPILDEEGKLLGYRGIYRDLTERLQILDQLRRYSTEEP